MQDLLIFWGASEQVCLKWKLDDTAKSGDSDIVTNQGVELNAGYLIKSEEILKADLSCLADMAESKRVSLILSSQDVVASNLDIPNRNPKLMRKAIPFMMEDEVSTSVDSLFYAYKDVDKNIPVSVRGIERDYLESLISQFESAEIKLEQILLEQDLLLAPEEGINILLEESNCSVINHNGQVWNCEPDDFSWLMQKQLADMQEKHSESPEAVNGTVSEESLAIAISLNIYSSVDCSGLIRDLPVGRFAVKTIPIESKESLLMESFSSANVINLMQDEYEPHKGRSELGLFLTKMCTIAAGLFIVFIIFQTSKIITLGEQKEQLDARKMTLYKQAFPTRKVPPSSARAVKNMRDHMKSLGSSSDSSGFLKILESSSQSLTDLDKVHPTNISYDITRNELRLDLIASNLVELDKFADALKSNGHQVERSSETQRGEGFSSRLIIRN
ncbi:MAG: general secretion pathway protein L [Polaribacter sp.]|jgi:general secretion pathway protein L